MPRLRRSLAFLLISTCAAGLGFAAAGPPPALDAGVTAFVGADVVPMDAERVLRDQTVVVANGAVVALGPSDAVAVPAAARRIDARGRFLMPALCDMHVHLVSEAWNIMLPEAERRPADGLPQADLLFPYLAQGVTTVQALSATPEELVLRGRIARGELLGPRLVLAPMIDGPGRAWPPPLSTWVATPEEARAAVRRAKADGYDKIKAYSFLSPESYDALVDEAEAVGMDVVGHVPMEVGVDHLVVAGQKMIAHSEELAKHARGDYSPAAVDELAAKLASHGVWMVPTLVTTSTLLELFADAERVLARPEAVYYRDPLQQGIWSFATRNLYLPIPAASRAKLARDYWEHQRPLTRAFHAEGGKLLAGSDTILPGLVPGFALHRELRELVDAGLTPYEALRTATVLPFDYLGESDAAGTVAVGQRGDLLLVDANPLADVAAASRIAGVLVRGRWLGADEIAATLRRIAAAGGSVSTAAR
jgi:imidazolonepropionase-like amidohydrolase